MRLPGSPVQQDQDAVSPLELFFDLVFIFAVSQLSHHLLNPVSWRGAAETLVLLIAVFGVWSGTSFEATLLNLGRSHAQAMLLAVMLVGLFMNAAIAHAFDTGGWAFVVPLLVIQGGRSILMIVGAPTRMLREHYARLLCWILATAPLWITGAVVRRRSGCCGGPGPPLSTWPGPGWPTPCPAARSTPRTSSSTPTT
jgi:low temperature requirement protein LtrA